ncbi:rna exonuclease, partial [Tieghemiomyces parasiticus]
MNPAILSTFVPRTLGHAFPAGEAAILWINCEVSGYEAKKDHLLEIAAVATDSELNIIAKGPSIVIDQNKRILDFMDRYFQKIHRRSGLTPAVLDSLTTQREAETKILSFVQRHFPVPQQGTLAGSSVFRDLQFISHHMPKLAGHLSEEII